MKPSGWLVTAVLVTVLGAKETGGQSKDRAAPGFSERAAACLSSASTEPVRRFKVAPDGSLVFVTPDPGKYLWNQIFALLKSDPSGNQEMPGATGVTVRRMIHALFTFPDLFHFNADGPAACLMQYPELVTPEDRRFFFEGHPRALFTRTVGVNYDLFTGEGTENHLAMSRFAAYLLCQNWLTDHPEDNRAQVGLRQAREYILYRADRVPKIGTGEWNSSTYYGYALRGPLLCREWAHDPAVKAACSQLLDAYAMDMALGYFQGVNARPESRGAIHASGDAERDQIAYLWWGDSPLPPHGATNAVWAALSSYRPPAALSSLANKSGWNNRAGHAFYNSHPSYLLNQAAESRETLFFGPFGQYAVSCAYLPYAGYTGATQQFIPMKIVARSNTPGQSAFTLIGNDNSRGDTGIGRGPYTQWAQYRNIVVQMTYVPTDALPRARDADAITKVWQVQWRDSFRRRFAQHGDEETSHGPTVASVRADQITSYLLLPEGSIVETGEEKTGRVFVRMGQTYLAIQTLSGVPLIRKERRLLVPVASGGMDGFLIEVGSELDGKDFATFKKQIQERTYLDRSRLAMKGRIEYTSLSGEEITVQYTADAVTAPTEPTFDWGFVPPGEADMPAPIPQIPPLTQPVYANLPASGKNPGKGWGRIPRIWVDGKPVGGNPDFLNTSRPWPLVTEK